MEQGWNKDGTRVSTVDGLENATSSETFKHCLGCVELIFVAMSANTSSGLDVILNNIAHSLCSLQLGVQGRSFSRASVGAKNLTWFGEIGCRRRGMVGAGITTL